jgi:hypothetical protein
MGSNARTHRTRTDNRGFTNNDVTHVDDPFLGELYIFG